MPDSARRAFRWSSCRSRTRQRLHLTAPDRARRVERRPIALAPTLDETTSSRSAVSCPHGVSSQQPQLSVHRWHTHAPSHALPDQRDVLRGSAKVESTASSRPSNRRTAERSAVPAREPARMHGWSAGGITAKCAPPLCALRSTLRLQFPSSTRSPLCVVRFRLARFAAVREPLRLATAGSF